MEGAAIPAAGRALERLHEPLMLEDAVPHGGEFGQFLHEFRIAHPQVGEVVILGGDLVDDDVVVLE